MLRRTGRGNFEHAQKFVRTADSASLEYLRCISFDFPENRDVVFEDRASSIGSIKTDHPFIVSTLLTCG